MNIYSIQQSIVSKLTQFFTDAVLPFTAFDLPDSPNDFQKAVLAPIVYVVYTGSKADPSVTTNTIVQPRKLGFSVEVHARSLYKANGLFIVRHAIELALVGFTPSDCQRMYLIKDDITKTDDNVWVHVFQFECQTMLVQTEEIDELLGASFQEMYLSALNEQTIQVIPVS